ncbi:uncharacterized protein J5F26_004779 [Ciconia maguari]
MSVRESLHTHHFSQHPQEKQELPPRPVSLPHEPALASPLAPQQRAGKGPQRRQPARVAAPRAPQRSPTATNRRPQQGGALREEARAVLPGAGPAEGVAAVRALRSHWLPTRKRSGCLRGGCRRAALRPPRTWRRRRGGGSSSSSRRVRRRMAAGRCRGSPTGWTCGSSSSSTWRFSWSSTCCPEGAGPRATI